MEISTLFNVFRDRVQRRLSGLPLLGGVDNWLRAHRAMYYFPPEKEIRIWKYLVDPNKASVEVGAHRGRYTYWLRRYSRHVYAYEPNPGNFPFLAQIKGNATVKDFAASNREGTATFRIPARHVFSGNGRGGPKELDSFGGTLQSTKPLGDFVEVEIHTVRLDDEGLENIGFIKIEAEGHEVEVLEGAKKLITRDRPVMQVAIKEYYTQIPVPDTIRTVEELGYAAFALTTLGLKPFFQLDPTMLDPFNPETEYIKNFLFFPNPPQ